MKQINQKNLIQILSVIFVITLVIISTKNLIPISKAEPVAATQFANGSIDDTTIGTETNPYQISNVEELLYFAGLVNNTLGRGSVETFNGKYIELTDDIDLSSVSNWVPIGKIDDYKGAASKGFRGTFNGNGHTIYNVKISITTSLKNNNLYGIGFFGATHGATIKNINLDNVTIEPASTFSIDGDMAIGALVGKAIEKTQIYNVKVTNFSFNDNNIISELSQKLYAIGGIAGDICTSTVSGQTNINNAAVKINNCIVKNANIITNADASNTTNAKQHFVGGIIGRIRYQTIYPTNCYFSGNIKGNAYVSPTFAGNVVPVTANHADFAGISGANITGLTNLAYNANATYTQYSGEEPNTTYNVRDESSLATYPLGEKIELSTLKTYVANFNSNISEDSEYYKWKSTNGELDFDLGTISASIYTTEITDATITLEGELNNTQSEDVAYEWSVDGKTISNTSNEITLNLLARTQSVTLKITLDGKVYEDMMEIPKISGDTVILLIEKTGIQYEFTAKLHETENNEDYTFIWKENNVEQLENGQTYETVMGPEEKEITLIATNTKQDIVYEKNYTIEALDLSLKLSYENDIITSQMEGKNLQDVTSDQFYYQWYEVVNNEDIIIQDATTNQLLNAPKNKIYKLVATYQDDVTLKIEGTINLKTVFYVDYQNGDDSNDGKTDETPVKTLEHAYTLLSLISDVEIFKEEDCTIVIMGTYADTTNTFANLESNVFSIPSTVTGLYNGKDYSGILYFYGGDANNENIKVLKADTKFENLTFSGVPNGTGTQKVAFIYAQGNDLTMGTGIKMQNYTIYDGSTSHGLPSEAKATSFHLFGGHLDYNEAEFYQEENETCVITVKSGSYARIIGGSRTTTTNKISKNIYGAKGKPFKVIINIDYEGEGHDAVPSVDGNGKRAFDIAAIFGGQADGAGYFDTTINYKNGTVGRLVGGSLGYVNTITIDGVAYQVNYFDGNVTLNISGGYIHEFYGGSLGRNSGNIYYYGDITLNMAGGIINGNVYTAGASAFTGTSTELANIKVNMAGGTITGNLYGGAYGYSSLITAANAKNEAGLLYGNITLNITGGAIEGNLYGGGRGSDAYQSTSKVALAQVKGTIDITISNNALIKGTIYGAGEGVSGFDDMAKVTGYDGQTEGGDAISIKIQNQAEGEMVLQNIYGAGQTSKLIGNTNIYVNDASITGGNTQTTSSTEDSSTIAEYGNIFGGGLSGEMIGNTAINILKGTISNVFGGGNQTSVTGATSVKIGDSQDLGVTVQGIVYGGGHGENSGDITVTESSNVIIEGINTKVGSYGSTELGIVSKEVYVTFKNYWTGNETAKYKVMQGIDRATTVEFQNSYVLLTNKDAQGNDVGISDIENLIIPAGSGIKISANGTITGDFIGDTTQDAIGGELYLNSSVCLTIGNSIKGVTRLTLNPEITESGNIIQGGIEAPYLRVSNEKSNNTAIPGVDEDAIAATEIKSGDTLYEIITKKYLNLEDNKLYDHYYIAETITIDDFVNVGSTNIVDRVYKGDIENTDNVNIVNDGAFTSKIKIDYELFANDLDSNKYTQITRDLVFKVDKQTLATIPAGTEITMIKDGQYYSYITLEDANKILLASFKDSSGNSFSEIENIRNVAGEQQGVTGITTYSEEYRFIINFSNTTSQMANGTYYSMINVNDGKDEQGNAIWIDEKQKENANNVVQIQNREYNVLELKSDKEKYEQNDTIQIEGKLQLSAVPNEQSQYGKEISTIIKFKNSSGEDIAIPRGTVVTVNDVKYDVQYGKVQAKIINNVVNEEMIQDLKISIDMSKVLPQDRLGVGDYTLIGELILSRDNIAQSNAQNYFEKEFEVFTYQNGLENCEYGLRATINSDSELLEDKIQLITQGQEESRTINLEYNSNLETPNIIVTIQKRTNPFVYETYEGKYTPEKITTTALNLEQEQTVTVNFGSRVPEGTYRILFELYDKYGNKKTESFVNFIVLKP